MENEFSFKNFRNLDSEKYFLLEDWMINIGLVSKIEIIPQKKINNEYWGLKSKRNIFLKSIFSEDYFILSVMIFRIVRDCYEYAITNLHYSNNANLFSKEVLESPTLKLYLSSKLHSLFDSNINAYLKENKLEVIKL